MERAGSAFDDGAVRPQGPEAASGSLNPDMVHRPLTPPAQQYRDDNDDDKIVQWPVNLIVVIRFLAACFTLSNFVLQCVAYHNPGLLDFLKVITFAIFLWNLCNVIMMLYKSCCGKGKSKVPEVSFIFGNWKFYCCGSEDDETDLYEAVTPKKSNQHISILLVDILLGTVLLVTSIIGFFMTRNRYYWIRTNNADFVLHFFVVAFEYILVILHIMAINRLSVTINLCRARPNDHQYRIRLPQDDRPKAFTKQPVSAVA